MDKIRVRGGATLTGTVPVSGSKNAALPILAASILVEGPILLEGVPRLKDVEAMLRMLAILGVESSWTGDGTLRLQVVDERNVHAPYHLVRQMRASFCLLGPLWTKRKRAIVSYPGGCVFGHRPIDLHLKGLAGIGAKIELRHGDVHAGGDARGGHVYLGGNFGSTVLGTANVLMAATLAKGVTVIEYAAQEPEIVDLCRFLQACGADIRGIGSHRLEIRGVARLEGCRHRVVADRIEAGTLLIAGVLTRGEVEVIGADPEHMAALLDRLRAAGVPLEIGRREREDWGGELRVLPEPGHAPPRAAPKRRRPAAGVKEIGGSLMADRVHLDRDDSDAGEAAAGDEETLPFVRALPWDRLDSVDVATLPYPGFPTDLQAQFMTLMCIARGVSVITEKVYPERFIHVAELARLGARIRREGPTAVVQGGCHLKGATMMASDLRASAALVLAGLVAEGTTEIRRVYHLARGYESLHEKLASLGADVERVRDG